LLGSLLPPQDVVRRRPWRLVTTIRGDQLRVRETGALGWVEALIPAGVLLNDPDGMDSPMVWRIADWPCLSRALADHPPVKIGRTMPLLDALLEHADARPWILNQAVDQLEGLRIYLLHVLGQRGDTTPRLAADTARRALYVRMQIAASLTVLDVAGDSLLRAHDEVRQALAFGPEDWIPLHGVEGLLNAGPQIVMMRLRRPYGNRRTWTGQTAAIKSLLSKLDQATQAAGQSDAGTLTRRLEFVRDAVATARRLGSGRGLDRLAVWIERSLATVSGQGFGSVAERATLAADLAAASSAIGVAARAASTKERLAVSNPWGARFRRIKAVVAPLQPRYRYMRARHPVTAVVHLLKVGQPEYASADTNATWLAQTRSALLRGLHEASGSFQDGAFLQDIHSGHVYRLAGGAPLYINSWAPFGGPQATIPVTQAWIDALRDYPAEGTLIRSRETGDVYRIAGGAPLYVADWSHVGGEQDTIDVSQWSIVHRAKGRLRRHPVDGTVLLAGDTGAVYRYEEGRPVPVEASDLEGEAAPLEVSECSIIRDAA
jgi:hypothetical protein